MWVCSWIEARLAYQFLIIHSMADIIIICIVIWRIRKKWYNVTTIIVRYIYHIWFKSHYTRCWYKKILLGLCIEWRGKTIFVQNEIEMAKSELWICAQKQITNCDCALYVYICEFFFLFSYYFRRWAPLAQRVFDAVVRQACIYTSMPEYIRLITMLSNGSHI